jgi:hypothetical protein
MFRELQLTKFLVENDENAAYPPSFRCFEVPGGGWVVIPLPLPPKLKPLYRYQMRAFSPQTEILYHKKPCGRKKDTALTFCHDANPPCLSSPGLCSGRICLFTKNDI